MIPSYHLPGGYSSTYQRQIYGMEPVAGSPVTPAEVSVEARRRIFYAPPVNIETTTTANRAPAAPELEPMRLGSDPISPPPKAIQRTSYDGP